MEKKITLEKMFVPKLLIVLISTLGLVKSAQSQSGLCTPNTPYYFADLSANPNAFWVSPSFVRTGNCCGTTSPDNCLEFSLLLHPNAVGIIFNVHSGAMPPGALFYQVNCGPQTPVGAAICLNGPGPHTITFCKPGNNQNQYSIQSISAPDIGPDITINDGCMGSLSSTGYDPASITWNSISPGAVGQYNNYLSCTTCANPNVQAQPGFPPSVEFQICGVPIGGCVTTPTCLTVTVYFNSTLEVNITPINPTVCFGSAGTTITAVGSGGTPPYSYLWSTGQTTASIFVGAGTYQVTLSDGSGCPPTSNTVTVTEFQQPITAFAGNDTTICYYDLPFQLNGIVTGVTTGIWSNGSGSFNTSNTDLTAIYSPTSSEITAGSTSLILTTTNNGTCPPASDTITINYVDFVADFAVNTTDVTCNGMSDGTADFELGNGMYFPYNFTWSTNPPTTGVTSVSGLGPGTYTLHISNAFGCDTLHTFVINEPPVLDIWVDQLTHVACFGDATGTATISASGGIPPYEYAIAGGAFSPNSFFSGLSAGTYTVEVKDDNDCISSVSFTIFEPTPLLETNTPTDVSCFGFSDGQVFVSGQGGVAPYTYSFNGGGFSTSQTYLGLIAGTYTYMVMDVNGCSVTNTVTINQPIALSLQTNFANVTCNNANDGLASVNVFGGTTPYAYTWSNNASTTNTANNLGVGTTTATVTDANGCVISHSFTITQPAPIDASYTVTHVSCFGGNNGIAASNVVGGTQPYSYSWSNGSTQPFASNLSVGYQYLQVTDANGCIFMDTLFITQPQALSLGNVIQHVTCFGLEDGSIATTPQGGVPPYQFTWSNGAHGSTNVGLGAGTYIVVVLDANNCLVTDTIVIGQPAPLMLSIMPDSIVCPNESIDITTVASGGVQPYQYNWNPITNNTGTLSVSPSNTTTYSVYIIDANNCSTSVYETTVDVWHLYQDSLLISAGDICVGSQTQVFGEYIGTANQPQYTWNNGLPPTTGPHTVSPPNTTNYIITVTDMCNNSINANIDVVVHPYPVIDISNSVLSGCAPVNMNFVNTAQNPIPGVVYSWDMGNGLILTGDSISYTYHNDGTFPVVLTATSPFGCESQSNGSHIVTVFPNPSAAFSFSPNDITILSPQVYFTNYSTGATNYHWDLGDGTVSTLMHPEHKYQDTGYYYIKLIAENQYGCTDTAMQRLMVKPYYNVYIPNAFTPDGDGLNDVFYVVGTGLSNEDFRMTIFDRWGKVIFTSNNLSIGWDGNHSRSGDPVKVDVYVYVVQVKDAIYGKEHVFRGHVSVVK